MKNLQSLCIKPVTQLVLLSIILLPQAAFALKFDFGAKGGTEDYQWEEFYPNGEKLLTESGLRYTLGGWFGNTRRFNRRMIYNLEAKAYSGTVDYDGHTQAGVKATTQTDYNGYAFDAELGTRAGRINGSFGWDFIGALGVDSWTRELRDSTDANGQFASGYTEEYTIVNTRLGTGPVWWGRKYHGRVLFGMKLPVSTNEKFQDIELQPKGTWSSFARFSNYVQLTRTLQLIVDIYYDSYRFDQSDAVGTTVQPKSTQDIYGVQAGVGWVF